MHRTHSNCRQGRLRHLLASPGLGALLLAPLLGVSGSRAETLSITSPELIADATIHSNDLDGNTGGDAHLRVGNTNSFGIRRTLVQFDVSAIPASATVTDVTLTATVFIAASGAPDITVHRLLASWVEGDGLGQGGSLPGGELGTVVPGAVTWSSRMYSASPEADVPWTLPGGDFVALPSAALTDLGSSLPRNYVWTSAGLVADVQSWVDGSLPNDGWIILGEEVEFGTARGLLSSDSDTDGPRLEVTYFVGAPPPTGAVMH